jgi:hypothetical protein
VFAFCLLAFCVIRYRTPRRPVPARSVLGPLCDYRLSTVGQLSTLAVATCSLFHLTPLLSTGQRPHLVALAQQVVGPSTADANKNLVDVVHIPAIGR